jgi:hypothetical protein
MIESLHFAHREEVMVAKLPLPHDFVAERFESPKKCGRARDGGKGEAPTGKLGRVNHARREMRIGTKSTPTVYDQVATENPLSRDERPHFSFQLVQGIGIDPVRPGEEDRVRAGKAGDGLAEPSRRYDAPIPKGHLSVDENQVKDPPEPAMLEHIIGYRDLSSTTSQLFGSVESVLPNRHPGTRMLLGEE